MVDDMNERGIVARLSLDLAALQNEGLRSPSHADVYRALLSLGVTEESARTALIEAAIDAADACGALHLRVLARLIALSHLPKRHRAVARELTALMRDETSPPYKREISVATCERRDT